MEKKKRLDSPATNDKECDYEKFIFRDKLWEKKHNKKKLLEEQKDEKSHEQNLIARNNWQNESGEISVLIYLSVFVVFRQKRTEQLNFSNSCATN